MSDRSNIALQVVNVLAESFAAANQTTIDPSSPAAELANLLTTRFQGTPDAIELFTRFQRAPLDVDLRAAVHGRLTEAMLIDTRFATTVEITLSRIQKISFQPSTTQSNLTVQLQGNTRGSTINQGNGKINQSRRTRISFPLGALVLLIGGGVVVGGGATVYSTTSSDAGSYTYYATPNETWGDFVVADWTTQQNGNFNGTWSQTSADGKSHMLTLTGHQENNEVEMTAWLGQFSVVYHCRIDSDSLICQAPPENGRFATGTLHKTTREQLGQIAANYKKGTK
jgi:hypothetical protein